MSLALKGMDALMTLRESHRDVGKKIHSACGGHYSPMDSLSVVALDRSMHNFDAFVSLLGQDNGQCAVVILRAQLDTLLRYFAHTLFPDPHQFAENVFNGVQIRKMKDPNPAPADKKGEDPNLNDGYLKMKFGEIHDWIPDLYDQCCAFAHFSNQHCWAFVSKCKNVDSETGERDTAIGSKDDLSKQDQKKLIDAFWSVTQLLFQQIEAWASRERAADGEVTRRYRNVIK